MYTFLKFILILFTTYFYVIAHFYLIIFLGGWGMDENWAWVKAAYTTGPDSFTSTCTDLRFGQIAWEALSQIAELRCWTASAWSSDAHSSAFA